MLKNKKHTERSIFYSTSSPSYTHPAPISCIGSITIFWSIVLGFLVAQVKELPECFLMCFLFPLLLRVEYSAFFTPTPYSFLDSTPYSFTEIALPFFLFYSCVALHCVRAQFIHHSSPQGGLCFDLHIY